MTVRLVRTVLGWPGRSTPLEASTPLRQPLGNLGLFGLPGRSEDSPTGRFLGKVLLGNVVTGKVVRISIPDTVTDRLGTCIPP